MQGLERRSVNGGSVRTVVHQFEVTSRAEWFNEEIGSAMKAEVVTFKTGRKNIRSKNDYGTWRENDTSAFPARKEPPLITLFDLILLHDAGVEIDAEDFARALHYENKHRDFGSCTGCCAITYTQHQPNCPRASVLFEPDWFERLGPDHDANIERRTPDK